MIASHLLKAVHYWTDTGKGNFELYYIRDKQKREVDFLVLREDEPFLLAEAKLSEKNLSPSLAYYAAQLRPKYSFQVVHHLKAQGISFQEAKFNDLISGQDFCGNLV